MCCSIKTGRLYGSVGQIPTSTNLGSDGNSAVERASYEDTSQPQAPPDVQHFLVNLKTRQIFFAHFSA